MASETKYMFNNDFVTHLNLHIQFIIQMSIKKQRIKSTCVYIDIIYDQATITLKLCLIQT